MNIGALMKSVQDKRYRSGYPDFRSGDTVRVTIRITEGEKTRLQKFEGVVIARRGEGLSKSFTLRRVSYGVGVEKTFPLHSPMWESIEVVKPAIVRRAKLSYFSKDPGRDMRLTEDESRVVVVQKVKKTASKTVKVSEDVRNERKKERRAKKKAKRASRRDSTVEQASKEPSKEVETQKTESGESSVKAESQSKPAAEQAPKEPSKETSKEVETQKTESGESSVRVESQSKPEVEAKPEDTVAAPTEKVQTKPEEPKAGSPEEKKE